MPRVLGLHSTVFDDVRALRTSAGRRERDRYAIEGPTLLADALAAGLEPELVLATEAAFARLPTRLARRIEDRTALAAERAFARVSELETPPGILAVLPRRFAALDELLQTGEPALVLSGVADPGNAGTLIRTAEIFGITRIVAARGGVEPHNSKLVRAAMGATFRVALAVAEPAELAAAARAAGYAFVATAAEGTPLPTVRFPRRALLAVGNERRGVADWYPEHDLAVAIPQLGGGESLNAAIAGGIVLYVFSQQFVGTLGGPKNGANP